MELAGMVIGLVVTGLFIGVCAGLLGIGGGMVMIPLLRLVFGLDAYMATATSLFTIIPTSLSGAISHVRNKTSYPQLGVALGLGGALTSAFGVQLAALSPAWAIMLVAAIIIFYSAYSMLRKALRRPGKGAPVADPEITITRKTLVAGFAIGMAAGLCAGYVGIGGGFLMVPLMTAWLGVPMKKASGTSSVAIIILSIPGVVAQMMLGHVDYLAGILLAVGSIPGAAVGARLVSRVNDRQLRFIFAAFLLVAGVMLILNELHVFA